MSTFTFTPDFGATKVRKSRATNIRFGDGYEQRVQFGMARKSQDWKLTFSGRLAEEAEAIEEFLDEHNGLIAFDWTPPDSATPLKFKCQTFDKVLVAAGIYTITALFEQVFEP